MTNKALRPWVTNPLVTLFANIPIGLFLPKVLCDQSQGIRAV